jgi:hypothetical protein
MANLGDIAELPDGSEKILTTTGWVENSPELEQAASMGGSGAFMANMLEGATMGLAGPANEAFGAVSPAASQAGFVAPFLMGGAGIARGAVRGRMAERVARAAPQRPGGGGMFTTEQGFAKMPSDMVPGPLAGTARAIEAGIGAIPGARVATDLFKIQRQRLLGSRLQRGLGFTDDEIRQTGGRLTPDAMEIPLSRVDDVYDAARSQIDEVVTPTQIQGIANDAAEAGLFTEQDIAAFTRAGDSAGDQLLTMRSELRGMQRNADNILQRRRTTEIIDDIQDIINTAAEGTPVAADLAEADRIYKLWKTVDNGGSIAADGTINVRTLQNALNRNYGSRAVKGGRGVTDPLVDDLIKSVDEMGQLGPAIPSSGTAERAIAAGAVGSALGIDVL